jgi:hypothetical protein
VRPSVGVSEQNDPKLKLTFRTAFVSIGTMAAGSFIQCRVSPTMKAALRAVAREQQLSESALIKRLIDVMLRPATLTPTEFVADAERRSRPARLYVRLTPGDQALLRERACARALAPATYASILIRAHLRALTPVPQEELRSLRRSTAELAAIGRNLNQLVRNYHQGTGNGATREDLMAFLRVCEALRDHFRAFLHANALSWTDEGATARSS